MCLSPVTIDNRSVYRSLDYSFARYSVPCCKCSECRATVQTEWRTRISYEISSLYRRGGLAIFLTFTYSDECLPRFTQDGQNFVCFNHNDVKTFLNRLKVLAYRRFGKGSYKYFFTSEYGKNTRRPHYHGLFFLAPGISWIAFALLAKQAWTYGFMFPKYDSRRSCFVDDKYNYSEIRIRSLVGGAKYVSKYVTKDLSFYQLPDVDSYLHSHNGFKLKPYLPKHWQSNLLGITALDEINLFDDDSVNDALSNGIVNPLTMQYEPLPRFIINKLCYKNVFRGRLNADGKRLYDRALTHFGFRYFKSIFDSRIKRTASKVFETFSQIENGTLSLDVPIPITGSLLREDYCLAVSFFHHLWSNVSIDVFYHFIVQHYGCLDDLFDVDATFPVWLHAKDSLFLKLHPSVFASSVVDDMPTFPKDMMMVFDTYHCFHYLYMYASTLRRVLHFKDLQKREELLKTLRSRYMYNFNKKLC
nr:MAG TPA: Replication associated protein [Microviridae sp.]